MRVWVVWLASLLLVAQAQGDPLTSEGCCSYAFWGAAGDSVLYLDRPEGKPLGLYRIGLEPDSQPTLVTETVGYYSPDLTYVAAPVSEGLEVITLPLPTSKGERVVMLPGADTVSFSPDGRSVAWQEVGAGNASVRPVDFYALPFDMGTLLKGDTDPPEVASLGTLYDGDFVGWWEGRPLLVGKPAPDSPYYALLSVDPETGEGRDLLSFFLSIGPRGFAVSPGGGWLAYYVAFSPERSQNGLWVVSTETWEPKRLEPFGAYRWRDDERLLVAPLSLQGETELLEVEVATGRVRALDLPPLRIEGDLWRVSPGGKRLLYLSAEEGWLTVLALTGQTSEPVSNDRGR